MKLFKKKKGNESKLIDVNLLTIPIYLNTRIVFDMLATLQNGFSTVKSVQITNESRVEENIDASLGTKNAFALLDIGLKAKKLDNNFMASRINEDRTHTPVSLYQHLRKQLQDNSLVKGIENMEMLKPGDFIEISGKLYQNPLVSMLASLIDLLNVSISLDKNTKNKAENQKIITQLHTILDGLTANDKLDLICENENMKIVMPVDMNYFVNKSMNELTDGNYKVFGKIVKICDENDKINLLRNTTFSLFKTNTLQEVINAANDDAFKNLINLPLITTEIKGPTLIIMPVSIYL